MRHTPHDVARGLALLIALTLLLGAIVAASGCVYGGAKITEGVDLAVGLTVPGSGGALQLNALNWLTGFRLGVAENAALVVEYSSAATNSFFGVVHTKSEKRIKATVEPCAASAAETDSTAAETAAP